MTNDRAPTPDFQQSPRQRQLEALWEEHLAAEFATKSTGAGSSAPRLTLPPRPRPSLTRRADGPCSPPFSSVSKGIRASTPGWRRARSSRSSSRRLPTNQPIR